MFAYPDRDNKKNMINQSNIGVNHKESNVFMKSSMMGSNIGQTLNNRPHIQQSEMVSGNIVAPEMIQNYNSKLLSNKQTKSNVNSKVETKQPTKEQSKKKKKDGTCRVF